MQKPSRLPISNNKIRIPARRRELITRQRLLDEISQQLDKRLLVIAAPAGYGKTSLLVDYSRKCGFPICWLSLDALDREPQRLLRYLVAAISERYPEFGQDSLAALESMVSLEQDEERILVTIANEINTHISEPFLLILDDYHFVGSSPFIGHILGRILQLTDEHAHILVSSRSIPDIPDIPLWIARNQVGGVTFERLAFLPEEIQQLFQQNNGIALSLQDAKTIVNQTEGWIAAIHLTNGRNTPALPRLHPLESTRELFDFFDQEVLQQQSELIRRFLLMTSCFEEFNVDLCEKVLTPLMKGDKLDWSALFAKVRTDILFSVPLDNEGKWMRYHHLFQHFLKAQLQFNEPTLAWHIQNSLALAYEQQESWEEAMTVYSGLNDYENLQRVLIKAGLVFIQSGQLLTLSNWLEKIPDAERASSPRLISLQGTILAARGENERALELYNLAESKLRDTDEIEEWTITLVRRAEIYRQLGQFDQALADVEQILELSRGSSSTDMQHTVAEAQRIRGLSEYGLGNMKEALPFLHESLQAFRTLGLWKKIPILETELGVVYRRLGQMERTAQYYASALKAWENVGNTGWKAGLLNNMGLLHQVTGRLEEARSFLEKACLTAERSGYKGVHTNALISLGDLLTDLSDWEAAYDCYDRALTLATNLGISLYIFYASLGMARLQRLGGEPEAAFDELKQVDLSQVRLGTFEKGIFNLEMGCCWLDVGKNDVAVVVLRDAVSLFEEGGSQMEKAIARLWLEVASTSPSTESIEENLRDVIPPTRDWDTPTPFMIHAGRAARWLKLRGGDEVFDDPLIRKFFGQALQLHISLMARTNDSGSTAEELKKETPQLEIRTFGEVRVRVNGKALNLSDWQTREARDLFFYLLQTDPRTKEQIALEFWPDITPARLKMRFKINIYRIRKAVGQDAIVFENERYGFKRDIHHLWDREKVDSLIHELSGTANVKRMELLKEITNVLKRPYLENLDAEWAVADRLRYQERYQELMLELAALHLDHGQPRACLETARTVLQFDPLLEAAHRLIIQAYATLHDPAGMTLQYRQYQQILMMELGVKPSSELSTLYEQLLDAI